MSTPGGPVQVALQGGSFTQGPTSAQVNPQGYQTPYGGISFTAQVPQAGGTLTVTLTFPQDLPQGAVLLKCTSSTACNPIQGAQLQGRTATFQVRDGGPLDADGQANGRIQDPVALGVPAPSPDFSIALNPDALTVPQGGSGTTTLTLTPQNGFTGQVTLTLERQDGTPAPSGIGLSPGSVNVTGSGPVTQTLTVSVGSSVATGSYALRVKATSGDLTRYANLSLTVSAPPGVNWTARTSGTSNDLYGVAHGGGLFVAVGEWGTILTSPDGVSWTARTSGTTNSLQGVTYGNGTFVAVGYNGTILTSSDGVNWTSRTSGTSTDLLSVAYGGGLFVAVGYGGTILTSSDGVNWTARTSGTVYSLLDVAYGNSTFVAVGWNGTILTSP